MARPRNPKRDEAFQLWLNSKGKIKLIEIAATLEVSNPQIRNKTDPNTDLLNIM
ncbi:phage terminase small subunit-related protein [Domibacillus sp. PGB-M46]|uniref:phage terminase small subunit-related protein n=1 Tax=Domibacillus sp. PGB-M46 TaxID=2910255 RepID=UPI001F5652E9|nr:phage terminase small subunit-related protein [Domibacillus sp. PGB-M46]MCI2257193.1 phage terminase small subunit-related protein [Domibacillus sp. PGB-M46]